MTGEPINYPKNAPFKDSNASVPSMGNLVDLPEVSTGGRRARTDSLIPGVNDKYLFIGGILVSTILAGAALSQTPAVQSLIGRLTNRKASATNVEQQEEQEIQPQQQQSTGQGFRVVSADSANQQAQAQAIAEQLQAQEQQRQLAHAQQVHSVQQQQIDNASMYDQLRDKDANTIKAYKLERPGRRSYASPFGANFSSS
jgi:hypothetical protein